MDAKNFELGAVRAAPEGANYLGNVAFAYRPSEFQNVRVTHSVEVDGEWKNYTDAEIEGARIVRVRSAFLCKSKNGELYVRASGIDVPWDVSRAVGEAAFAEIGKRKAER